MKLQAKDLKKWDWFYAPCINSAFQVLKIRIAEFYSIKECKYISIVMIETTSKQMLVFYPQQLLLSIDRIPDLL